MIFKQIEEIITGKKTQTRRIVKPNERAVHDHEGNISAIFYDDGRKKIAVGDIRAVVPKRGMPQVFYRWQNDWLGKIENTPSYIEYAHETLYPYHSSDSWLKVAYRAISPKETWQDWLKLHEWQPLSIRIIRIRQEHLLDITHQDALAEGVQSLAEYRDLWRSINGRDSWYVNPSVWVLEFEVVT